MAVALKLLEDVGAIRRVKKGRVKIITVTPEGAFRGNVNNHAKAVEKYRLDVIDGGKSDECLRRLDERTERMADDILEIKRRVGALEEAVASLSRRLDRIDERVSRIEKRLDLVDHSA